MTQQLSVTGRMQTEIPISFGSGLVLDSGPLSVSALRLGSFIAAAAAAVAAPEALGISLLVKLIFITCRGAQIDLQLYLIHSKQSLLPYTQYHEHDI